MPKQNTPLFSLEAHGTIGNTLTYQGRGNVKVSRSKPILPFSLSLNQQYQRWLYADYIAYWHQQTSAVKATYRRYASRHHTTAFAYWMQYHLSLMPDIVGWWKLDSSQPATTPDSSRNLIPGTVFGASPVTGFIAEALQFDGNNDYVLFTNNPVYNLTDELSVEAIIYVTGRAGFHRSVLCKARFTTDTAWVLWVGANNRIAYNSMRNAVSDLVSDDFISLFTRYHILATDKPGQQLLYVNGVLQADTENTLGPLTTNDHALRAGTMSPTYNWFEGLIDNIILYNRILTPTDAFRHSERSFAV